MKIMSGWCLNNALMYIRKKIYINSKSIKSFRHFNQNQIKEKELSLSTQSQVVGHIINKQAIEKAKQITRQLRGKVGRLHFPEVKAE